MHREYSISISTSHFGGRIKVHTAIVPRSAVANLVDEGPCVGTTRLVSMAPLDLILMRALDSAKLTADVLAARGAEPKARR